MKIAKFFKSNRSLPYLVPVAVFVYVTLFINSVGTLGDSMLNFCNFELESATKHFPVAKSTQVFHAHDALSPEAIDLLKSADGPSTFQTLIVTTVGSDLIAACSRGENGQHWQTSSYTRSFYTSLVWRFAWNVLP